MITKNKKGSGKKAFRANKKITLMWSSIVNQIIQLNSQHWEMEINLSVDTIMLVSQILYRQRKLLIKLSSRTGSVAN